MHNYAVPEVDAGVWVMGVWQAEEEKPVRTDEEIGDNTADAHYYKELRTTSGHTMIFCDKPGEEYIEVRDKDNNFWRMDDKDGYIRVEDKDGSYILMKSGDIEIHAAGNMKLQRIVSIWIRRYYADNRISRIHSMFFFDRCYRYWYVSMNK